MLPLRCRGRLGRVVPLLAWLPGNRTASIFLRFDSYLFLTIDRWQSPRAFEEFCEEFAEVYQILDKSLEGIRSSEKKVGVFSVM